jgi:4-hydroxybenzoyl-CoA thioesterase
MTVCFTTDRSLRFGDCDVTGTAYYPSYLNILNGVVEEFWTHIGWPWQKLVWEDRWATPTVHLSCDFAKPSFFGDTLTFRLTVLKVGRSSLRLGHTIHCGPEHRWSAEQVLAASHLDSHSSTPWPDAVRAKLESLMAAPDPDRPTESALPSAQP